MHIYAQQNSIQVSSNFVCVCQFCKTFLHYKLVIWDCLSKNQRLRCPLSPPFLFTPELTKTGLFQSACSRGWLVLAREAGAFSSSEIWSVSSDLRSWVADFTLTFPPVSADTPTTHALKDSCKFRNFQRDLTFYSSLNCPCQSIPPIPSEQPGHIKNFRLWLLINSKTGGTFERSGRVTLALWRLLKYGHVNNWCFSP